MDPITTAIAVALAQAAVQGGVQAAKGTTEYTPPGTIPQSPMGGMDFSQLVQQRQSNLPKLNIQDLMRQGGQY